MFTTKKSVKQIVDHLKEIQGNDLYIAGKCRLNPHVFRFEDFFIKENPQMRLMMLLKPDNSDVNLILIVDGRRINGGKNWLSRDEKTVCFGNGPLNMFILRTDKLSYDNFNQILSNSSISNKMILPSIIEKTGRDQFYTGKGSNPLCDVIIKDGYIPIGVGKIEFTATFEHEKTAVGRFTLMVE